MKYAERLGIVWKVAYTNVYNSLSSEQDIAFYSQMRGICWMFNTSHQSNKEFQNFLKYATESFKPISETIDLRVLCIERLK